MNKSELIQKVAERVNLTKKRAEVVVNLIFDSMTNALSKGGRVEIRGLGSFAVREYGSYNGRNPRTGESIQVNPKKLPFFKVGKELKKRVNEGSDKIDKSSKTASSTGSRRGPF